MNEIPIRRRSVPDSLCYFSKELTKIGNHVDDEALPTIAGVSFGLFLLAEELGKEEP